MNVGLLMMSRHDLQTHLNRRRDIAGSLERISIITSSDRLILSLSYGFFSSFVGMGYMYFFLVVKGQFKVLNLTNYEICISHFLSSFRHGIFYFYFI